MENIKTYWSMILGKHSNFDRKERDYYPTPIEALMPLLEHLESKSTFIEPCAGDGRLIRHLERYNFPCIYASDIEPVYDRRCKTKINKVDVLFFNHKFPKADFIITNTPWDREILHEMIDSFRKQMPTWLLFDADWMYTKQAVPYLKYCEKIVSVGRISWEGNGVAGKDNCAWYLFVDKETKTEFIGR